MRDTHMFDVESAQVAFRARTLTGHLHHNNQGIVFLHHAHQIHQHTLTAHLLPSIDRVLQQAPPTDLSGLGKVWFHGVTEGKQADNAKLAESQGGSRDGTFFITEVASDDPMSPAWVLTVIDNVR